ncbi:MAG: type II toxin-antitoxin system HicB family antitoxin [Candidatus Doudnabacteria bacterium]|nr:type II toxin-antitoxin system HicB family antitoxin [Candidatus Doudnabacteria bacterium]
MKHIIQFRITKYENYYVAEGLDLAIVTQGNTLDEVVANLKEALQLHLEGENLTSLGLAPDLHALVNYEVVDLVRA